jgi:hypothetical protein
LAKLLLVDASFMRPAHAAGSQQEAGTGKAASKSNLRNPQAIADSHGH